MSKDIDFNEIDGKSVLLCLIDIEQRPSRRCLSQLALQAESLASKGVTFVVVQVSWQDGKVIDESGKVIDVSELWDTTKLSLLNTPLPTLTEPDR